jgi:hypothetical protein
MDSCPDHGSYNSKYLILFLKSNTQKYLPKTEEKDRKSFISC